MALTARRKKLETVKQLVYSTGRNLTKAELDFMQQHAYKKQVYMFVHTEEDKHKAEDILHRLKDTQTIVMLVSEDDMKL